MKKRFQVGRLAAVLMLASFLVSCNAEKELKKEEDKVFYSLGVILGERFKDLNLTKDEVDFMVQGLKDTIIDGTPKVKPDEYKMKIQELLDERVRQRAEVEKKKGDEFVDKFMQDNPTAKKTASGLVYLVLEEGKGKNPTQKDVIEAHYHGTLTDGKVFDSSRERGQTAKFPLDRVIKGWTEGLQLVKEGGKIKLVIPSHLGYGMHGAPPNIAGGSTLIFEVELVKINPDQGKSMPKAPVKKVMKKALKK